MIYRQHLGDLSEPQIIHFGVQHGYGPVQRCLIQICLDCIFIAVVPVN